MWSSGPSDVNSGTVTPHSRNSPASHSRYTASLPKLPYSFSAWTRITGPPRTTCCSTTCGSSSRNHRSTTARYSASRVRTRRPNRPVTHTGRPPFSHSAQMYGPGRTIAHSPARSTASRNRPSAPTSRSSPSRGSCRFHGTYVSTQFRPIAASIASRWSHCSSCTRK
ncbi:hypothetical protein GA0115255_120622 [Streptomyces sp. Ncost-T6T-2b]|nr:hypothetical protein GA0115255_120622 [Streptomyces sp. Ncost-T6T-2b]